jgi:hypothetical protein
MAYAARDAVVPTTRREPQPMGALNSTRRLLSKNLPDWPSSIFLPPRRDPNAAQLGQSSPLSHTVATKHSAVRDIIANEVRILAKIH